MVNTTNDRIIGDGNISVEGDVGEIYQYWTKVHLYGDGSGYRDIVVRDEIDGESVVWLRNRFAEPGRYADARSRLGDDERTVFLQGEQGSGRWTAAVCLLAEFAAETDKPAIKVIEAEEGTQLNLRRVPPGALVLVDLTGVEGTALSAIEKQIKSFKGVVGAAQGRLVVLMSGRESSDFQASYGGRIVKLLRPEMIDVARKHLDADGLPGEDVVATAEVVELLKSAGVADVARFAQLVRQEFSEEQKKDDPDKAKAIERAVEAYNDWSQTLIGDYDEPVQDKDETERRSLLLSVALLNGGDLEALYRAERMLRQRTGCWVKNNNPLAGKGFAGRLRSLPGIEYRAGRAKFTRRAYDASVLKHVWSGYPDLRRDLVDWVVEVGESIKLSDAEAKEMVDRFAEFCASQGIVHKIAEVAKKWALNANPHDCALAARLLTVAALDARVGPGVHRQLYDWTRSKELPMSHAEVIRAVCVSEFGRAHTDKALTRLGYLADHDEREVSDSIVSAVLTLVRDYGALTQALGKLGDWLAGERDRRKVISIQILIELTDPDAMTITLDDLASKSDVRALFVRIWTESLSTRDNTVAEPAVHAWLSTAVARPDWQDPVLDILTEGAKAPEAHPDRVGNLMMCANRWYDATRRNWPASEDDRQAEVYRDLQARLTRVETTPGERIGTGDG